MSIDFLIKSGGDTVAVTDVSQNITVASLVSSVQAGRRANKMAIINDGSDNIFFRTNESSSEETNSGELANGEAYNATGVDSVSLVCASGDTASVRLIVS